MRLKHVALLSLVAAAQLDSQSADQAFRVTHLRCEFLETPIGLDESRPRLSWQLESARRAESQSAYRILVASNAQLLEPGRADLWDSGIVSSDRSTHVQYDGKPLTSRQRYHWRAIAWNRDKTESAHADSFWETGFVVSTEWQADWIGFETSDLSETRERLSRTRWMWPASGTGAQPYPQLAYFRLSVDVPAGPIARASLLVTADGELTASVNGKELAIPDLERRDWTRVSDLDLTKLLVQGRNVLAVLVRNNEEQAGLLAHLRVESQSGPTRDWTSADGWRATMTRPAARWRDAAFDDRAWHAPAMLAAYGERPWRSLTLPDTPAPSPYLRKTFGATKAVSRARLYASALGLYELHLNGKRVGEDLFAPGWTDYRKRIQYQTYDVTSLVRTGDNTLGAILGDGWYAGMIGWESQRHHYGPYPLGLIAELHLVYTDGSHDLVRTDESWRATAGPIVFSDLLAGETYDARRELAGWTEPGYDDTRWKPVLRLSPPGATLVAERSQPVGRIMELATRSVSEPKPGHYVFDLGQNMVGWVRLTTQAAAGTTITLRFAEMLQPDGTIYTTNLRGARATDTYICRGGGLETFEPRFTFHGFRYVEVTGFLTKPSPDAITGIVISSATPPTGTFETSNPMINQLQQNIVWSQRGNFLSIPTDCPQRDERLGWMGDAEIFARTACFNMDVAAFFTKWMQDVEDGQSIDGGFPDVAPRIVDTSDGAPGWGDAGVIVPWTMFECYEDRRMLERHYEAMQKWVAYIRRANPGLLWRSRRNNNFGDWVSIQSDTPKDVLATAFFAQSARLVGRAARVLGRERDAEQYEELFQQIKRAFNDAYVDAEGRVEGRTQTAYALALEFDLLPQDKRPAAVQHLVAAIDEKGGHLSTGFLGVRHLLPALTHGGRLDVAYRLLNNETFPSWGYSIKNGATTIWERWDGWTDTRGFQDPGMNSFNHYSFGSVGEWLYRTVAGIDTDPEAAGFRHIVIRPQPGGGLTFAKASYQSIRGSIGSHWRVEGNRLALDVETPVNTTATVHVPARRDSAVEESGRPAVESEGVRFLRWSDGAAVYAVGSGTYRFRSSPPEME